MKSVFNHIWILSGYETLEMRSVKGVLDEKTDIAPVSKCKAGASSGLA